jgi:transcriptional regulator with XRE-family HTH domain
MMQGSLAHKVRVLRAERGLTLREAASLTGVAKETISDIERGLRHPHDPTLAKIARGYDVPVEELLEAPVPLGETTEVGHSELARDFLVRVPSAARRTEDLERAAGIVEGYVRRWAAELECLTEKGVYPYGKGIETDYLYQGIAKALQKGLMPYAIWVTKERSEEVSESERTASRRLLEAVKSMAGFVERARDTEERQRRSDPGEVSRGLAEFERILFPGLQEEARRGVAQLEQMLAHIRTG